MSRKGGHAFQRAMLPALVPELDLGSSKRPERKADGRPLRRRGPVGVAINIGQAASRVGRHAPLCATFLIRCHFLIDLDDLLLTPPADGMLPQPKTLVRSR